MSGLLSVSSVARWLSPISGDSCRALVVGAPGSGKTLLLRALAQLETGPTIVIDPEYGGSIPGWYRSHSMAETVDLIREGHVPVIAERWAQTYDLVWSAGRCLLVIDEAADCGARRNQVYPPLGRLLRRSRHRQVSVLLATQKRTYLDADVQALARSVFVGQMPGASDKRWALDDWGIEVPAEPLRFCAVLPGNQRGEISISV